ncbi:protein of unknown function [Pseudomonas mediterranea]
MASDAVWLLRIITLTVQATRQKQAATQNPSTLRADLLKRIFLSRVASRVDAFILAPPSAPLARLFVHGCDGGRVAGGLRCVAAQGTRAGVSHRARDGELVQRPSE